MRIEQYLTCDRQTCPRPEIKRPEISLYVYIYYVGFMRQGHVSLPGLELVIDELDENVVLDAEQLGDSLSDPWLHCVHIYF